MPCLTLSQKEKIVTRRCDGISAAQITTDENITERYVLRVYQQWEKHGTIAINPGLEDVLSSTIGKEES